MSSSSSSSSNSTNNNLPSTSSTLIEQQQQQQQQQEPGLGSDAEISLPMTPEPPDSTTRFFFNHSLCCHTI